MLHTMKLQPKPFSAISRGEKDIEMRLNDEKRKLVKVGDRIEFFNVATGESVVTEVIARHEYPTFEALYSAFEKTRLGYLPNEPAFPSDMSQYYPEEEILSSGVVGIEIKLL